MLGIRYVGERTLLVERSLGPDGALKGTKTGQIRSVRLMAPLRKDLVAWRKERPAIELVSPPVPGRHGTRTTGANWRHRVYVPAAKAAGITIRRPYDLRHSAEEAILRAREALVPSSYPRDSDQGHNEDAA